MKKVFSISLSIYFLIGSMIPNGDFFQLTLIPDLLNHYELHQQEAQNLGEQITFFDFLIEHYISTNEHEHEGEDEHPCMPMQQISTGLQFVFSVPALELDDISIQNGHAIHLNPQPLFSSDFTEATDRPPSLG